MDVISPGSVQSFDGNARNVRQSLVFSRFPVPELNALLNNPEFFSNCIGHWKASVRGVESVDQLRSLCNGEEFPAFFLLPMKSERTNQLTSWLLLVSISSAVK